MRAKGLGLLDELRSFDFIFGLYLSIIVTKTKLLHSIQFLVSKFKVMRNNLNVFIS